MKKHEKVRHYEAYLPSRRRNIGTGGGPNPCSAISCQDKQRSTTITKLTYCSNITYIL